MSDEIKKSEIGEEDPKARFREALNKKNQNLGGRIDNKKSGTKIIGGQTSGNAPKLFRRKSGSA